MSANSSDFPTTHFLAAAILSVLFIFLSLNNSLDWLTTPVTSIFSPLRSPFVQINQSTNKTNMKKFYRLVLGRALWISWSYKWLWPLGLAAVFVSAGSIYDFLCHLVHEFLIGIALRPTLVLRAVDLVAFLHLAPPPRPRRRILCHMRLSYHRLTCRCTKSTRPGRSVRMRECGADCG